MTVDRPRKVPPGSRTSTESPMSPLMTSSTENVETVSTASSEFSTVYELRGVATTTAWAWCTRSRSGGTTYVAAKTGTEISAPIAARIDFICFAPCKRVAIAIRPGSGTVARSFHAAWHGAHHEEEHVLRWSGPADCRFAPRGRQERLPLRTSHPPMGGHGLRNLELRAGSGDPRQR